MHVVVTGSTGFIGRHLVRRLAVEGHQLTTLARSPVDAPLSVHHALDIGAAEARTIAAQGEAIIHLAGLSDASSSRADPFVYNQTNALGTLNMLEAARQAGARLILASTQRIYRPSREPLPEDSPLQPADPYAYSKLVAEKWVEMYNALYGLGATVVRFFSVYGPGQVVQGGNSGVVSILVQRGLRGEDLWVDRGLIRDFTYVGDVVQGILLALARTEARGRTYNIATGQGTELTELAYLIKQTVGTAVSVRVRETEGPGAGYLADITRAQRELGYYPQVDLGSGLESYVQWLRAEGQITVEGPAHTKTTGR